MSLSFHIPEKLDRSKAYTWLASWFGCGFINPAPGTWGSIGALPFGVALYAIGDWWLLLIAAVFITIVGLWSAHLFDQALDGHDSKMIVIDEVAGQWIAMIPAALNPALIVLSFIFFRFFDILKPWPVSFFDQKVKGAVGVMGDDIIAGIMAAIVVICVKGML